MELLRCESARVRVRGAADGFAPDEDHLRIVMRSRIAVGSPIAVSAHALAARVDAPLFTTELISPAE